MYPIPANNLHTNAPNNAVRGCWVARSVVIDTTLFTGAFSVPDGVYTLFVTMVGSGASADFSTNIGASSGAAIYKQPVSVVPGQIILYSLGQSPASAGNHGVASTFGSLSAPGGLFSGVVNGNLSRPGTATAGGDSFLGGGGQGLDGNAVGFGGGTGPTTNGAPTKGGAGQLIVEW